MKGLSLSFHKGKNGKGVKDLSHANSVSDHNIRGEKNPKSNDTHYPEQAKFNRILIGSDDIKKDIIKGYKEYFEDGYSDWNKVQRKSRRERRPSYLRKMDRSKYDIANEIIVGFGKKEDWAKFANNWQNNLHFVEELSKLAEEALKAYQEQFPNEKIVNAVIHFDESTPHLHVISLSVHEGYNGPKFQHLPSVSFTPNVYATEPRLNAKGERMLNVKGDGRYQRKKDENGDYIILQEGTLAKGQTNIRNQLNEYLESTPLKFRFKAKSKGRGFDYTVEEYKAKAVAEKLEELNKQVADSKDLIDQMNEQLELKKKLEEEIAEKQEQIEKNKEVLKDQKIDAEYLVESRVTTDVDIEDAVMIALNNITRNNNMNVPYKEIRENTKQAITKVDNRNARRLFDKLHCDNEQTAEQETQLEL